MIKCSNATKSITTALAVTLSLAQSASAETREWRMDRVNGAPALGQAGLRLSEDGALSGRTGCNSFTGTAYFADGFLLVNEPMATTRMACSEENVTAQEETVLRVLKGAVAVAFDPVNATMTLSKNADEILLRPGAFAATGAETDSEPAIFDASYVNVFGLSGPLNIRSEPTTDSAVVTRVLAGTLLRNKGCEHRSDRDWCEIEFIDASGRFGWAAAEYLQAAPALLRAKEEVFDRIGTLTCVPTGTDQSDSCDFGLARDGDHSAAVVVYRPDSGKLLFGFVEGELSTASGQGKALTGLESKVTNDTIRITLTEGTYEIPLGLLSSGQTGSE